MTGGAGPEQGDLALFRHVGWLRSEIALAALIVALSALTALASFQGSAAASQQSRHEAAARRVLDDADGSYRIANQEIIGDYAAYDSWLLRRDAPGPAEQHEGAFSPALRAALERSADDPFDEAYYAEMYSHPTSLFAEADALFGSAREQDRRSDRMQLVMTLGAVGLGCAAWASLAARKSRLRLLFAALGAAALVTAVATYLTTRPPPG